MTKKDKRILSFLVILPAPHELSANSRLIGAGSEVEGPQFRLATLSARVLSKVEGIIRKRCSRTPLVNIIRSPSAHEIWCCNSRK
jgi:hypothetical protein